MPVRSWKCCRTPPRTLRRACSAATLVPGRRSERKQRTVGPCFLDGPGERRSGQQPRAVGAQPRKFIANPVGPVRVEQRGCGCAVGHCEIRTRRPGSAGKVPLEPGVSEFQLVRGERPTVLAFTGSPVNAPSTASCITFMTCRSKKRSRKRTSSAAIGSAGSRRTGPGYFRCRYSMMMLVSTMLRSPSTSSGNLRSGQRRSHSAECSGHSGPILRTSKGVPFSYKATSTFCVYEEKG